MKRTTGILVFILALVLVSACAQTTKTTTPTPTAPVLDRIVKRGELVVGTAGTMPPLNMVTKSGALQGIDIDLAGLIASGMGVKARFETMPFDQLLPALESGKVDMVLSGMTATPQRNLKVAFVGPYLSSGKSLLTKHKTLLSVKKVGELNSSERTFAALRGSTSEYFVQQLLSKAKLVAVKDYNEGVALVLQDKVDALVADMPICVVTALRYPDQGLAFVKTPLTYEPLCIAVPPGDPLLVNWLENFLKGLKGSGELAARVDFWLKDPSWLKQLPD
jgi:polar amino acid transport system substrate-binding protein